MRVLFLLTNPIQSPGERYRVYQFLPLLRELGVEAEVDCLFHTDEYDVINSPSGTARKAALLAKGLGRRLNKLTQLVRHDLVHTYRQAVFPMPGGIEGWLQRRHIPYVFDLDDSIFLDPPEPLSRMSKLLRSPRRVPRALAGATLTTVGNPYLANYAFRYTPTVEIIPTCVDLDRFTVRPARVEGSLIVGWIGSRSTAPYLSELDDPLRLLAADLPNTVLRVVGGEHRVSGVDVQLAPWSLAEEVAEVHSFDIGVMPLPNDRWTQGKSGLKILQYMAAGVPVVASPVGVNREIIHDGHNGFLARDDREWYEKLKILATDPETWSRFSEQGRRTVARGYSLHAWAPKLGAMFELAVESHRKSRG